ncbi:MAG: hypothetical protein JW751_01485 [Polyangiaceae bacterium]|nr:hypothetical protein [Polyangiaceae bacterium]
MSAQRIGTPLPVGSTIIPGTLRARLEELRAKGQVLLLQEAVGVAVPLCLAAADRHAAGHVLYLHPSAIRERNGRWCIDAELAALPPTLPRDRSCLAPEERAGQPGTARSSVFSIAAILYELVTAQTVGPGMRRPTEIDPSLPPSIEAVMSKALVADPAHRPDDLLALAQALHHLAPAGVSAPPPADESHLDHVGEVDVDVSMSLMPPPPARRIEVQGGAMSPFEMIVKQRAPQQRPPDDQTAELSALKARLESDPRPRYVVIKDGMDHGPFNAVELLQQIASNSFLESDYLRDTLSAQERMIKDWDEFAPFAEHARIHRDIKAEKAAIERVVVQESRSTTGKALIGVAIVGALIAVGVVWLVAQRGVRRDKVDMGGEAVANVDTDGGLAVGAGRGGGSRWRGGGSVGGGNYPQLGGGMSCEAAQAKYVESYDLGPDGRKMPADLTAGAYGAVLNRGTYLNACGVPSSMSVSICAAVQNGRAVGVSVSTSPSNPRIANCIAGQIRAISFPSHPRLDVTRTTFAAN